MALNGGAGPMAAVQIIGRSSSHFTRVTLMFAHELGVPVELVPVFDVTQARPGAYADNPALKFPVLRRGGATLFGTENICRALAELGDGKTRIVWPEQLRSDLMRNAQELVWHALAAQVQIVFGALISKLPADNLYFTKGRAGFEGALRWLEEHLAQVLDGLPGSRDLSLLEVTLFCVLEHLTFRQTLPVTPYPALMRFAREFGERPSAQSTVYRFDTPPAA